MLDPVVAAASLREEGYCRLDQWLDDDQLDTLVATIGARIVALDDATPPMDEHDNLETLLRRSATANTVIRELVGDEMAIARAGHRLQLWPEVAAILASDPIASIAAAYLDDPVVVTCSVIRKAPGSEQAYSAHRDTWFLHPAPERLLTIAIALDPATTDSGGLGVIPRSHREPTRWRLKLADGHWRQVNPGPQPEPPGALQQQDLAVGEALLFDGRTWHGSGTNRSKRQRRLLVTQLTSASATWPADSWILPGAAGSSRLIDLGGGPS